MKYENTIIFYSQLGTSEFKRFHQELKENKEYNYVFRHFDHEATSSFIQDEYVENRNLFSLQGYGKVILLTFRC